MAPTAALLTDLYELAMAAAYVAEGMSERPATFSLFVRNLPAQRGYLVAAGLEAVLDHLETFHFSDEDLGVIDGLELFDRLFLDYLAQLRFRGSVRAVGEGSIIFAEEPVLEVDAPIAQGQLVETYLLNQITTATTLASKAARFRQAAGDTPVIDFGLRRAQGADAGMAVARALRICGLAGTSNVAGGHRYGVSTSGTMAHSFIQAYDDGQRRAEPVAASLTTEGCSSVINRRMDNTMRFASAGLSRIRRSPHVLRDDARPSVLATAAVAAGEQRRNEGWSTQIGGSGWP